MKNHKDTLSKITAAKAWTILLGCIILNMQAVFADYYFDNFSASDFSTPFSSSFTGHIPLKKRDLTPEQKEKIRLAKEELTARKLKFSSEEFVKQIKKNKKENIELMLDAGMSPNADYFGEYSLTYAVKNNKTDIALLLLEKGANPNIGFDSSLFWAAKKNNIPLAKALIENGAKVDYTELVSSKTILCTALEKNNIEIAKILLENGAKIDVDSARIIDKKNLFNKLEIERWD